MQAHGLVERFSRDLDVATENPAPMREIVASLTAGLTERGWQTTHVQTDPLSGRFLVTDPVTGEACEVGVLKEAFWAPPAQTPYGPVLSLDDVIGTKVRALADRGTVRDLIDVQAASRHRSLADLESLGRRRAQDEFSLADLRDRLTGADWYEDEDYTAYGLTLRQVAELKTWAGEWATDLGERLHDENC
ncbi:nucleotidyltransferase AbiEii toxin of type IV toxin-antitoxin system [Streptomyces sp. CEV 2-1]|nr:nucleotidyltransferase AbiEii toxin of type IV toxin-antitoxin system [Streptomyces sp. CEV 2-1]